MTVIKLTKNGEYIGYRVYQKGASEIVLARCSHIIVADNTIQAFSEQQHKQLVSKVIQEMADRGLRTICVAYKDYIQKSVRPALPFEVRIRFAIKKNIIKKNIVPAIPCCLHFGW